MKKIWLALIGIALAFSTSAALFNEGEQYIRVENPLPVSGPEVTEFFSFYCPACYQFEEISHVSDAIKASIKQDVKYRKFHVDFMGGALGPKLTQAWAVAMALKVEDKVKGPLFKAVQQTRTIRSEQDIRQVFLDAGINVADFDGSWNSFIVKSLVLQQQKAAEEFQLRGVPAIYVNGQYQVKNDGMKSLEEFAQVTAFLTEQ